MAAIVLSLALAIVLGSKDYSARSFAFLITVVSLWIISTGFFYSSTNEILASFFMNTNYFLGTLISVSFFYFSLTFPENTVPSRGTRIFLSLLSVTMLPLYYLYDISLLLNKINLSIPVTNRFIITNAFEVVGPQKWGWNLGEMDFVFYSIFFGFWMSGLAIIYFKSTFLKSDLKNNARYMFFAMVVAVSPPALMNIILPGLHIFNPFWFGILSTLGWTSLVSYSIIKFNQMNVRTVSAELLILAAIGLLFLSIFI